MIDDFGNQKGYQSATAAAATATPQPPSHHLYPWGISYVSDHTLSAFIWITSFHPHTNL